MKNKISWRRRKTTADRSRGTVRANNARTELFSQVLRVRMAVA